MIYLKLSKNQDQEWSLVTISSLAKMLVGVNNIVVENLDFSADDNEIIISARPYKRDQCRCGICGRKAPGYDCGSGLRRWRAMDIGNSVRVYVESKAVRVKCPEHGVVVQQFPWARHKSRFTKNFLPERLKIVFLMLRFLVLFFSLQKFQISLIYLLTLFSRFT